MKTYPLFRVYCFKSFESFQSFVIVSPTLHYTLFKFGLEIAFALHTHPDRYIFIVIIDYLSKIKIKSKFYRILLIKYFLLNKWKVNFSNLFAI